MPVPQHQYDPFLRPDWRFERVLEMIDRQPNPGRCTRHDDRYIREARSFILRWRNGNRQARKNLERQHPGLFFAWNLWEAGRGLHPNTRFMAEARLLARQPLDRLAKALKVHPDVVHWYERLFFNVLPWIDSTDWIGEMVLNPAADRMVESQAAEKAGEEGEFQRFVTPPVVQTFYDFSCKLLCYYGGEHVCEVVFRGLQPGSPALTKESTSEWMDESMMLVNRRRSAQASMNYEINKYNVMELFNLHMRIIEMTRGVEAQEGKQTETMRNIHAAIKGIPFLLGRHGQQALEDTPMAAYEDTAMELRSDEQLLLASGQALKDLPEAPAFPDARAKNTVPTQ